MKLTTTVMIIVFGVMGFMVTGFSVIIKNQYELKLLTLGIQHDQGLIIDRLETIISEQKTIAAERKAMTEAKAEDDRKKAEKKAADDSMSGTCMIIGKVARVAAHAATIGFGIGYLAPSVTEATELATKFGCTSVQDMFK